VQFAAVEAVLEETLAQPELLPAAMGKAARELGFDYFCMVSSNLERPAFLVPEEQSEGISSYFNDGWVNVDYRQKTERPLPLNTLYLDHRAVGEKERKSSAIYNELFVPMRMAHYAGIRFRMGADEEWFCFVCRSEEAGVIEGQSAQHFKRIAELAMNSASVATRIHDARASGMLEGLVRSGVPAVLLDGTGRVVAVTSKAEAMFRGDFGIRKGRLWSANAGDARSLGALAAFVANEQTVDARRRVFIQGQGRARPVMLTALRVLGPALDQLPGARVLVTLEDLNPSQVDVSGDLHDMFGLSDAEAQIAALLHDGHDLASIAEHRSTKTSTIRKQVSRVFEKMNVHRQAEVVQLVAKLKR
jgi:DNA-binding CsgD family transcriptional regulator